MRTLAQDLSGLLLASGRADEVVLGINLISSFARKARGKLEGLTNDPKAGESPRIEALAALASLAPKETLGLLGRVLGNPSAPFGASGTRRDDPRGHRSARGTRGSCSKACRPAPDRVQTTIAAGLATRKPGAEALLAAIASGKASARLLQEPRVINPLNGVAIPELKEKLATLLKGLPPADQRLKELIAGRRAGYRRRDMTRKSGSGFSRRTARSVTSSGAKGPVFVPGSDGVGIRGVDRLLEDILDPNRNVNQAFRVTNLALNDGRVVTGLLLKEEGAVLVLADSQGKEVRIPKEIVDERTNAQLSPMPGNFVDQVPESEFYNLLAYLLSRREPPKTQ